MLYQVRHKKQKERYLRFTITPVTNEVMLADGKIWRVKVEFSYHLQQAPWNKKEFYKVRTDEFFGATTRGKEAKVVWQQTALAYWELLPGPANELNTPMRYCSTRKNLEYVVGNLIWEWAKFHDTVADALQQQKEEFNV